MRPITFDRLCYRIDGRCAYLNSGEFHYFRVPKKDWRERMRLLKAAGGNCLATYTPWLIHEPQEGRFVFGSDDGVTDVEGFIAAAAAEGLYVVARPGPYQYSELVAAGLARWLTEAYPEILARGIDGKPYNPISVSYLHPLFLEKVRNWFAAICPILARHTVARGGPVALAQPDNELAGIHLWMGGPDYHPETMGFGRPDGRYARFLRTRYGDPAELNRLYGTDFAAFEDVRPTAEKTQDAPTLRRRKDYFDFYCSTVAEYVQVLASMMREFGLDVPLVHNSASTNMNAHFLETVSAFKGKLLLGSDHYYNLGPDWPQNNPTPQYAARVFCSTESLRLMGFPPTVWELPGGSCSDWPAIHPNDLKACYFANLALGMKGHNYYVFTGGPNPPGAGSTTDNYDYGAGIGAAGEVRPIYRVQEAFGRFIAERPWLAEARREHDVRIAVNLEMMRAGNYWAGDHGLPDADPDVWDFVHRGLLTTAFCASFSPNLCRLDADDWADDPATPVIVPSGQVMSAARQQAVVRFCRRGGAVLIAPLVPALDERFEPCTVLADFLGCGGARRIGKDGDRTRLNIDGVPNVFSNAAAFVCECVPPSAAVLGTAEPGGGCVCWTAKTDGGGTVIHLAFRWLHAMSAHSRVLANLLGRLGAARKVVCSNPNVWTSLRTAGGRSVLFLVNLTAAPLAAQVTCRPAWSADPIDTGARELPAMTVLTVDLAAQP